MRVALSLLTLDPRIAGGSETYVRELCAALDRIGRNDYQALVSRIGEGLTGQISTTVASGFPVEHGPASRARSILGPALRPGALRDVLDRADVVHYPVTVPVPRTDKPTVVTLHDVQHHDLPTMFSHATRAFRRFAYDRAARRATRVVVVSEWARGRAIGALRLDPGRVHAIHHGVDLVRFSPSPSVEREPLLVYPARRWAHKNHAVLFEAFAELRAETPDLRLVLTGRSHPDTGLPPGVDALGHVPADALADLYRRAAALVFPSRYEGFGLPVLEAMACGCPVACSDLEVLREVAGDAAVFFAPDRPESVAAGVREALERHNELSLLGPAHAARFTWDAAAVAHEVVYANAAAG